MQHCQSCGDAVETVYDCPDCEDTFCVDCRTPTQHACDRDESVAPTPRRYSWKHYALAVGVFVLIMSNVGGASDPIYLGGAVTGASLAAYAVARLTSTTPEPTTA